MSGAGVASYGLRLGIPGTANLRDLGGYPASGGEVAPGLVYRSEVLALPGAGEAYATYDADNAPMLRALGLRTVVDLRSATERERTPAAWPQATGATTVWAEIPDGGEGSDVHLLGDLVRGARDHFGVDDLADYYRLVLDRRADVIGRAVAVVADPANHPVVVHCSAGKDRTGLVVAVVLSALGTPRPLIVSDYALTGRFRPERAQLYAGLLAKRGISLEAARVLFETPAAAMESALDHLETRYGGSARYLTEVAGLSLESLETMRASLVRPTA